MFGLTSHELTLKEYTVVMLLRNLNATKGLDGTKLSARKIVENSLDLEIITGGNVGQWTSTYCQPTLLFYFHNFSLKLHFAKPLIRRRGKPLTD